LRFGSYIAPAIPIPFYEFVGDYIEKRIDRRIEFSLPRGDYKSGPPSVEEFCEWDLCVV